VFVIEARLLLLSEGTRVPGASRSIVPSDSTNSRLARAPALLKRIL